MTLLTFNRVALPLFAIVALLVLGLLPAYRMWRRTGVWPVVVHRPAHALQRWTAGWLFALLAALAVWIVLYSWQGPEWLDVWNASWWLIGAGWLLTLLGLGLTLLGQLGLGESWRVGIDDRPTELVTGGIYHVIRNPIFAGAIVMIGGLALVTPSPWTIMGWVAVLALFGVQTRTEEQHLLRTHGEGYRAYAASVGRFLPRVGRLRDVGYPEHR